VPAHWALEKLKYIARFSGGGTPDRERADYWKGDIPWVSPKDMKVARVERAEEAITQAGLEASAASLVDPNAVLMVARSGILKHSIPVALNEVPVALNQDMKAIRFGDKCQPKFFLRWVQGHVAQLLLEWSKQGATVESIEQSYLERTYIPLPTIKEQEQIIRYIDKEMMMIDILENESEGSISLLQERRSTLISAAVTGKIDVTGLAEHHAEPEPEPA
jgi:type I restriction enzyme S subunit